MAADQDMMNQVLDRVPQQHPIRFIHEILELDDEHIVGAYRFCKDEYFYEGHFPDRPITPGVILIEAMAQTGVVAFGLYLNMIRKGMPMAASKDLITLFTLVEGVEFTGMVHPGERVLFGDKKCISAWETSNQKWSWRGKMGRRSVPAPWREWEFLTEDNVRCKEEELS
jgi:3-hydroxyacyl-[acyl-carrier-protein] dehydratase